MATRQERLRELRRRAISKEGEIKRAEARLKELETVGFYGEWTKQERKVQNLKAEAKNLQARIGKRETTLQKKQRRERQKAANG